MTPYGWTKQNSIAAYDFDGFEHPERGQSLYAWRVETAEEVQAWLEDSGGWDGTIYDAELVDATGFISRAERLFLLPKKSSLPDLSWITRGWVVYEGVDEVSIVGEGNGQWLVVYWALDGYTIRNTEVEV